MVLICSVSMIFWAGVMRCINQMSDCALMDYEGPHVLNGYETNQRSDGMTLVILKLRSEMSGS